MASTAAQKAQAAAQAAQAIANATGNGKAGKAIGGAASGAASGAALGSVVPVLGTALGGVLGGVAGGIAGLIPNKKDAERQRQINAFAAQLRDTDPGNDAQAMTALQGAASSWAGGGKAMAQQALAGLGSAPATGGGGAAGAQVPPPDAADDGGGFLEQAGSALRRLNGGKALTAGNLIGGGAKNLAAPQDSGVASSIGSTLRRLNGGKALTLGNLASGAAKNMGGVLGDVGGFVKENLGEITGAGVGALGVKEAMEADKLREQALAGVPNEDQLGLTSPDASRYRSLTERTDAALADLGGGTDERLSAAEQGAGRYRSLIGPTDVQGRLSLPQDVASSVQAGRVQGRLSPRAVQSRIGSTDVQGGDAIGADVDQRTGQYQSLVDTAAGGLSSTDPLAIADRRRAELGQFLDPGQLTERGEIAPSDSARLDRYRSLSDSAQAGLGGPDRTALAKQTLADLEASTARERTAGIRDIGQAASKFGRLGSGMVTTRLGDLESVLQERSGQRVNELAAQVAEGDISDRYRTLDVTRSGEQSIASEEAARRAELRGERAYGTGIESENLNRTQSARMAATGYGGTDADRAVDNRYRSLSTLSGLEGQAFGESQSLRAEARGERDYGTGLETANVNRRMQADMYGTDVDAQNEARRSAAEEANLGYDERDLSRQFDADTFNAGLAERNLGRRSAAEAGNLDIETGNVNRRIGVGQDALGYGATVAGQGIDDRYRSLQTTSALANDAYSQMAGDRSFNAGQANDVFARGMSRAGLRGNFAGAQDARAEALINAGADLAGSAANRKAYGQGTGQPTETNAVSGWVQNQLGRLPGISTATSRTAPTSVPTVRPNLSVQQQVGETPGAPHGRFRSLLSAQPGAGMGTPGATGSSYGYLGGAPAGTPQAQALQPLINVQAPLGPSGSVRGVATNPGGGGLGGPVVQQPAGQPAVQAQPIVPMKPQLPAVGAPQITQAPQLQGSARYRSLLKRPTVADPWAA